MNNDRINKKTKEELRIKFLAELSGGGVPEDISMRATNELLRASDHLLDANQQPDFQKTVNLFAEVWANAYRMGKIKTTPPSSQGTDRPCAQSPLSSERDHRASHATLPRPIDTDSTRYDHRK